MTDELATVMKVRKLRREDRKLSLAERVDTKPPKLPVPLEREIQSAVLAALQLHPRVVKFARTNAGTFSRGGRHITGLPKGWADITGMLDTGEFLAIELKRPGEKPEPDQIEFRELINRNGGVAFIATSVADVWRHLGPPVRAA